MNLVFVIFMVDVRSPVRHSRVCESTHDEVDDVACGERFVDRVLPGSAAERVK